MDANERPRYYAYVIGEETNVKLAHKILRGEKYDIPLRDICYDVMYNESIHKPGISFFLKYVKQAVKEYVKTHQADIQIFFPEVWRNISASVIYFYNRQFIVQLSFMPKKYKDENITVPIQRSPARELQADLMQLLPEQRVENHQQKYLVVIVDPFSRFVWAHSVQTTESKKVASAFLRALNRPGKPQEVYHYIKDKLRVLRVDGGSEFKRHFEGNFKHFFNERTKMEISRAKRYTSGRPSGTGPIEAAIRTLRQVIRDYELKVSSQFLRSPNQNGDDEGLSEILAAYNSTPQLHILEGKSPEMIVNSMIENQESHQKEVIDLTQEVEEENKQEIEEKLKEKKEQGKKIRQERTVTFNSKDEVEIAYRLYYPPAAFVKQVTPRVSTAAYVLDHIDRSRPFHPMAVLTPFDRFSKEHHQKVKKIPFSSLVVVKTPIEYGPDSIEENVIKDEKKFGEPSWEGEKPSNIDESFTVPVKVEKMVDIPRSNILSFTSIQEEPTHSVLRRSARIASKQTK